MEEIVKTGNFWYDVWTYFGYNVEVGSKSDQITEGDIESADYVYGWYMYFDPAFKDWEPNEDLTGWKFKNSNDHLTIRKEEALKVKGWLDAQAHCRALGEE